MSLRIAVVGAVGNMGSIVMDELKKSNNIAIAIVQPFSFDHAKSKYPEKEIAVSLVGLRQKPDVVIDFSTKSAVQDTIQYCKEFNVPLVECVTGLSNNNQLLLEEAGNCIPIFYSSNTSIGIAILREAVKTIAASINPNNWHIDIIEHHHSAKVDKPSGTALTLSNDLSYYKFADISEDMAEVYEKTGDKNKERNFGTLEIHSIRSGKEFCEHTIMFSNQNEVVKLKHGISNKIVFAVGAIRAAFWLLEHKKPGLYSMANLLGDVNDRL